MNKNTKQKESPKAICDGDLKIGDTTIKCAVLEDGTRVLTRTTFIKAIGRKGKAKGGRVYDDEFKTPVFLTAKNLKPFIPQDLIENSPPVIFDLNGTEAIGYKADLLPQVCGVYIDADYADSLLPAQKHIAEQCKILLRGFATVGIIALVDEVTGYQDKRTRDALNKLLEKVIAKELQKWVKTFPDEFYQKMFKLKGWNYNPSSVKRPGVIGKYTNDLVYERLAPGVLEALQEKNPKDFKGRRRHRHHQWLSPDEGRQKLREHLWAIIGLMRVATNWRKFNEMIERAFPKEGETMELLLELNDDVKEQ